MKFLKGYIIILLHHSDESFRIIEVVVNIININDLVVSGIKQLCFIYFLLCCAVFLLYLLVNR